MGPVGWGYFYKHRSTGEECAITEVWRKNRSGRVKKVFSEKVNLVL